MNYYFRSQSHSPVYVTLLIYYNEISTYLADSYQWEIDFWGPPAIHLTACC